MYYTKITLYISYNLLSYFVFVIRKSSQTNELLWKNKNSVSLFVKVWSQTRKSLIENNKHNNQSKCKFKIILLQT